jgi:tetratricopeptide (TPR) repeat protein/DNA-binding MarR family transcriptional regulator
VPVASQIPGEILDYVGTHTGEESEGYGISQRELAKAFGYHACSMSRPLGELVRKGLLKAQRAPVRGGNRKQLVYGLTDRGRGQLVKHTRTVPLLGNELPPPPNPFLGRRSELRELMGYALEGGGLVYVEGPSGIGKTALVSRHLRKVRSGRVPFWFTIRPGNAPHHFVNALAHALSQLKAPQLAYYAQLPRQPVGREVADLAQRALGDRELVAVIDDIQAAEPDMRKFLSEFLSGLLRGRHDQVYCIGQSGSMLPPEEGIPTFRVTVSGLDRAAAHDLTDRLGGLADRFESVYQSCLGSPFLLKLATSHPDLEATEGVLPRAVVTRLPEETFLSLVPLALATEPLPMEVVADMGLRTTDRVEELVRTGLLRHTAEGRVELLQIVRSAIVERAGPGVEKEGHRRLAEYYNQSRRPEAIRERFLHLVASEGFVDAVETIREHQQTILNVGFSESLRASLRHLTLALPAGPDRVLALRVEASLLQLHSDYTEAILSLRRAIVESGEDHESQAECLLRIVDLYVRQDAVDQGEAALESARRLGPFQPRLQAFLILGEARILEARSDWGRAQGLARQAFELSRDLQPKDVALESITLWSKLAALGGEAEGALQIVNQGLTEARRAGRLDIVFSLLLVRARVFAESGDAGQAQDEMRAMRSEAEALGYLSPLTYTLSGLCALASQAGRWDEALAYGRQATSLAERLGNQLVQGHTLGIIGSSEMRMAAARSDPSLLLAAREHAEKGVGILQKLRVTDSLAIAQIYLAEIYLDLKLLPLAKASCLEALRHADELGLKWLKDQIQSDFRPRFEAAGGTL